MVYLSIVKKKYTKLHEAKVAEVTKRYAVKPYTIEDVFLIHENGTLIIHQTRRLKPMDNDILSGMLTAIKDFIRDVFKVDMKGQLNELKFGKMKILIEHGQFSFLAVVVTGNPPRDVRKRMKKVIGQVNQHYHQDLKNYIGDTKRFDGAKTIIDQNLLGAQDDEPIIDEDSDAAWNNKGVILTKLGKYNEAIECFDKALKINSHVSNIWLNRGIALVKLNEFEEAMDCFDRALQLDPGNDAAKRRRNKCWYKWKLIEGRERRMGGRTITPRTAQYSSGSSYEYDNAPSRHEGLGGAGATAAASEEPPPECPKCYGSLEYIDEFQSWYCSPCDSYPYDD
jgi:tetratricopeptide (TPR) repeat protein